MKTPLNLFKGLFILIVLFSACRKAQYSFLESETADAKEYFEGFIAPGKMNKTGIPRMDVTKYPVWEKAYFLNGNSRAIVIPVTFKDRLLVTDLHKDNLYDLADMTNLVMWKDSSGNYQVELITAFPDSNSKPENFTGVLFVGNWSNTQINKYKFEKDGTIKIFDSKSPGAIEMSTSHTVCYYIQGFNSSADDPYGYSWIELVGCQTYVYHFPQGKTADYRKIGGGGGGGGGGVPRILRPTLLGGNNIIGNISDYNKCFINKAGNDYSYQVSVCVAQPQLGSRTAWSFIGSGPSSKENPVFVGHAFLVLRQQTPQGTIVRNIGFYPRSNVTPLSPTDQGQLNDDSQFEFDVALNIEMTNSQFFQIIEFVKQGNDPGFKYDLNSNNCVTFLLNALAAAGINLPRTTGTWPNGAGCNPGDLGEDIRNLPLQPKMSRELANRPHPNEGNCY